MKSGVNVGWGAGPGLYGSCELLESRLSYYDTDLLVVGWNAALIYDTVEGAAPTVQLLEYANSQLLEFRYYDTVLTRLLSEVYRSLDRGPEP